MKKIFTLSIIVFFTTAIFAQSDTTEKRFRHEFGIDVSSILGGILIATDFGFATTEPYNFPLNYRLYTPIGNLRAGFGLSTVEEIFSGIYSTGLDTLEGKNLALNTRLGIEKMQKLSRLWSFYYGVDYEYSRLRDFRQSKSVSQGYMTDWRIKSRRHGIAPFLGFRLDFNDRIGLQTELKLIYTTNYQEYERDYTAIIDNPSNLPEDQVTFTKTVGFDFKVPNFLMLTVKL